MDETGRIQGVAVAKRHSRRRFYSLRIIGYGMKDGHENIRILVLLDYGFRRGRYGGGFLHLRGGSRRALHTLQSQRSHLGQNRF